MLTSGYRWARATRSALGTVCSTELVSVERTGPLMDAVEPIRPPGRRCACSVVRGVEPLLPDDPVLPALRVGARSVPRHRGPALLSDDAGLGSRAHALGRRRVGIARPPGRRWGPRHGQDEPDGAGRARAARSRRRAPGEDPRPVVRERDRVLARRRAGVRAGPSATLAGGAQERAQELSLRCRGPRRPDARPVDRRGAERQRRDLRGAAPVAELRRPATQTAQRRAVRPERAAGPTRGTPQPGRSGRRLDRARSARRQRVARDVGLPLDPRRRGRPGCPVRRGRGRSDRGQCRRDAAPAADAGTRDAAGCRDAGPAAGDPARRRRRRACARLGPRTRPRGGRRRCGGAVPLAFPLAVAARAMNGRDADVDALFERDADARLLDRRRREELGLPATSAPPSAAAPRFGAESLATEPQERRAARPAALRLALEARPDRELIPGALVTVVATLHDDGDQDVPDAVLRIGVPPEAEPVPGSFARDDSPVDGEALLGAGLRLGAIPAGGAVRLRFALRILPGTDPLDLIGAANADGVPAIGTPALRLRRRAGHTAYDTPKPFFELEADERVDLDELAAAPKPAHVDARSAVEALPEPEQILELPEPEQILELPEPAPVLALPEPPPALELPEPVPVLELRSEEHTSELQ